METVFAVLDTNTFLHYVSVDQIDWLQLIPNSRVVIFICPPVIRELNKHKDTPRTSKLRDRAASAIRKIESWAEPSTPVTLSDGTEIRFVAHDSNIDFAAHNLVRDIADDHLIATALQLQAESPLTTVVLVTKDIGLKLKARAHRLATTSLPDSVLLPEEILPNEKKIKELEAEVRELRNARPKLRLAFPDGSNKLNLSFQRTKQLAESDIANMMMALREKYPAMAERKPEPSSDVAPVYLQALIGVGSGLSAINTESIRRYNEALEGFLKDYEAYLEELAEFYEWESRTAAIEFILVNDGTSPADDIDIFIHFPDGFELFGKSDYEEEPEAPKAPRKPRSILEEAAMGFSPSLGGLASPYLPDLSSIRMNPAPSNVSGPRIKRTNSYDVNVSVQRAKHGLEERLKVMYLTFEPSVGARSFIIEYVIHASNLPKAVKGTLNVIV